MGRVVSVVFAVVAVFIAGLMAGCSGSSGDGAAAREPDGSRTGSQTAPDGDDTVRIGFSMATDTFIIERWNKDIKVFNSAAQERGAEVLLQMSAGGTQAQIEQVRYLFSQNIDVLVVLPHDTDELAGVAQAALDRGIPVCQHWYTRRRAVCSVNRSRRYLRLIFSKKPARPFGGRPVFS